MIPTKSEIEVAERIYRLEQALVKITKERDELLARIDKAGKPVGQLSNKNVLLDDGKMYAVAYVDVNLPDRTKLYSSSIPSPDTAELINALKLCVAELLHDGFPLDTEHSKRIALSAAEMAISAHREKEST